ncbi:hypothetical protein HMPREF9080_01223 [Cardiobacterium valvarum F0432]|uniref:Uncharacterized protein n=1 Tax=Cardiobacterium valvarum F0432 TaxID=797473 RepID=G9ZEP3_9GAMM|nr:hypothetical protein HMPREF9080_01223 [Cardiobacterium valvarum F0432]
MLLLHARCSFTHKLCTMPAATRPGNFATGKNVGRTECLAYPYVFSGVFIFTHHSRAARKSWAALKISPLSAGYTQSYPQYSRLWIAAPGGVRCRFLSES